MVLTAYPVSCENLEYSVEHDETIPPASSGTLTSKPDGLMASDEEYYMDLFPGGNDDGGMESDASDVSDGEECASEVTSTLPSQRQSCNQVRNSIGLDKICIYSIAPVQAQVHISPYPVTITRHCRFAVSTSSSI